MDLLTPTVNVAAERAKLRRLRNEINADAQARLAHQRNYTARGYRRAQLPDLSPLATQSKPSYGAPQAGHMRTRAALDVLPNAAPVPETNARSACCGRCACGMGLERLKA